MAYSAFLSDESKCGKLLKSHSEPPAVSAQHFVVETGIHDLIHFIDNSYSTSGVCDCENSNL